MKPGWQIIEKGRDKIAIRVDRFGKIYQAWTITQPILTWQATYVRPARRKQ